MKNIVLAFAMFVAFAAPVLAGQQPAVLRFAHAQAESDFAHIEAVKWGERVAARTSGQVSIEVYANAQLGVSGEDLMEQQRQGSNLAYNADAGRVAQFVPEFAAIAAPYVIENYEQLAALPQLPCIQAWTRQLEQNDLTVIAWNWAQGYRHIYANKTGNSPADFANTTLRAAEAPLWVEAVKTLGAIPVVLPYGEMYTGIQTKIVDGCEQSVGTAYNMKLYEVCKYMVETRHIYMGNCITVGTKWLDTLSEEHRRIVIEECVAAGDAIARSQAASDLQYIEEMVKAGLTLVPYADLDIAAFKKQAEASYAALGVDEAIRLLKQDLGTK